MPSGFAGHGDARPASGSEVGQEGYVHVARAAGLGQRGALLNALRGLEGDPREIAGTLRAHHLTGLLRAVLPDEDLGSALSAELFDALQAQRPVQPVTSDTLLRGFEEVRGILEAEGVPLLLLKGFYFAERLYGGVGRRPQQDIDILVRSRQRRQAGRALARRGFARQAYDLHSRTLVRGELKVDVHGWLRWAPAFRIDERAVWASAQTVRIGGLEIVTLSDEFNLVLLALGCLEDLGQGMAKLKQALDLFLFLRQLDGSLEWEAFFGRRERENLAGITASVFALVVALFEAEDELPRLRLALDSRRHRWAGAGRQEALDLLFAPRKHAANLAWFRSIYPGSLAHYLAWFWLGGFPENLRQFKASRLFTSLRVVLGGPHERRG
jgi:putative nucleotidyltransferase-like protein